VKLLTAPGIAGIAVLSFGVDERARLLGVLRDRGGGHVTPRPGGPPRLVAVVIGGAVVDEALVVDRGDAGVELHVHGGRAVVASLAEAFGTAAAGTLSPAQRLLRDALSVEQLDLALEQGQCTFQRGLDRVLALPEPARSSELAAALVRSTAAIALATPARLVLVGAQNAGKSTLLNRLLFAERALTGEMPGLTRDPVAELTTLAGYPYDCVDTAGEGAAADDVDRLAIEAGRTLREGAIVVLIVDAGRGPGDIDRRLLGGASIVVANKGDLPRAPWPADVPCGLELSARCDDAAAVRRRFGEALLRLRGLPPAGPVGGFAALDGEQLAVLRAFADAAGS
jgi:small GTP-binding protein